MTYANASLLEDLSESFQCGGDHGMGYGYNGMTQVQASHLSVRQSRSVLSVNQLPTELVCEAQNHID